MIVSVKLMEIPGRTILVEFLIRKKKITYGVVMDFLCSVALPSKKMNKEETAIVEKAIAVLRDAEKKKLNHLIDRNDLIIGNMEIRIILKNVVVYNLNAANEPMEIIK